LKRLYRLLLVSDVALIILYALIIRSVIPNFGDVVIAYLFGSVFIPLFTHISKLRAFREAWKKAHPSS